MARGARGKFGAPVFEPNVFRMTIYRIEGSTCDIVGTFWRPENCAPLCTLCYAPDQTWILV